MASRDHMPAPVSQKQPGLPSVLISVSAALLIGIASLWAVFDGDSETTVNAVAGERGAPRGLSPEPGRSDSPPQRTSGASAQAATPGQRRHQAVSAPAQPSATERPAAVAGMVMSPEELFAKSSPAVARILVLDDAGQSNVGSGFFVTAHGLLVTNHHVVGTSRTMRVQLADGQERAVQAMVKVNERADLALLKVAGSGFRYIELAAGPAPPVGAKVYAIGYPLGLSISLSEGLVSALQKDEAGLKDLQTTAAISPGSSGGPLLAADGRAVGVTLGAYSDDAGLAQDLNLAIPAEKVLMLLRAASGSQATAGTGRVPGEAGR